MYTYQTTTTIKTVNVSFTPTKSFPEVNCSPWRFFNFSFVSWPELNPVTTPNCKGDWQSHYFDFQQTREKENWAWMWDCPTHCSGTVESRGSRTAQPLWSCSCGWHSLHSQYLDAISKWVACSATPSLNLHLKEQTLSPVLAALKLRWREGTKSIFTVHLLCARCWMPPMYPKLSRSLCIWYVCMCT